MSDGKSLPQGWQQAPLSAVVENLDGRRIPVKLEDRANRQGSFPYYGASGVIDYVDDYLFDGSYLLIAEDGANLISRTTPIAFEASGKFWVNNHAHVVQPLGKMPIGFLEGYFGQIDLRRHITGTAQPKLTQKALNNLSIPIPPLNEQKRIVAKLEALQARSAAAKEALDAIPPLLEKFRQSVLAAAFRGDLTKGWRAAHPEVEPASVLLERIRVERRRRWEEGNPRKKYVEPAAVDGAGLGELPEGWCWASVEELCWDGPTNGYSGATEGNASGTLTMKLSATTPGKLVLNDATTKRLIETVEEKSKFWLQTGDLLVQRANSLTYLGAAAIFASGIEPMVYPDLMMRLRPTMGFVTNLLWRYFNSTHCRAWFRSKATGTAGNMPKINGAVLRSTAIPLPPEDEATLLLHLVGEAIEQSELVENKTLEMQNNHSRLDQAVLAKAFRGELVPQDPNDEPASVLLERIRNWKQTP